jgi:hypothetical protein
VTLQQLLDMLKDNILHDRSDRVAGTPDYLWSDATLVAYINEAQRRFARRGLIIRDGSSSVTRVNLKTGVDEYPLDPSVLAVMSAKVQGDKADLGRAGHAALDTYRVPDTYFFDPSQLSSMPDGKPLAFATDEYLSTDDYDSVGAVTLRVYPTPSAAYNGQTINLRVIRMPIEDLTTANMSAVPEIPVDHHLEMLDWAAYLALRIVDVDGGMPALAERFKASFEENVKLARDNAMRKLFAPAPFGFGRNGWSWTRDAY